MQRARGFTLIELMIAVAVIGILAAIAIPSYNEQIRRGRRAEAHAELGRLQLAQERWRADRSAYASNAQLSNIGGVATLPSGYYTIALSTPSGNCANDTAASAANSYTITATAAGNQAGDSRCATIVLTSLCGVISKSSTPAGNQCW